VKNEKPTGCMDVFVNWILDKGLKFGVLLSYANTAYASLADEVSDWYLFYKTYWISMKPENNDSISYKIVLVALSMIISSTYLLRYSALISLHSDTDLYSKKRMSN
jgi:hypothetical protein